MLDVNAFAQFLTIVVIFIGVLVLTYFVTKWIAGYQQGKTATGNIDVIETYRLSQTKYVQILRLGDHYVAIAVCKDSVTTLAQLSEDEIHTITMDSPKKTNFNEILNLMKNKANKADTKE